ncbi:interleukin-1 receptor accessory protein-like 1 [Ptychodera flava]|uniref:interleukin-1 receptor accessory protein-like 1 n=1 Tax=Ptychodera flava TaxID=63121 RepID=UPI00396A55FB
MAKTKTCALEVEWVIGVICVLIFVTFSEGVKTCDQYNDKAKDKTLTFTNPDMGDLEFGTVTQYKAMSCCASGYTSMIWYKGSVPYPWKGIDPAETYMENLNGNQTLKFQYLKDKQAGNYTCSASNGTHSINHTKTLWVEPMQFMDKPKELNSKRCRDYSRLHGGNVTFYCEFYFGYGGDEDKMIYWIKENKTGEYDVETQLDNTTYITNWKPRDKMQTIGSYLYIYDIQSSSYADYTVYAQNGYGTEVVSLKLSYGDPNPEPFIKENTVLFIITIAVSSTVVLTLIILAVGIKYRLNLQLIYKYHISKAEENGEDKKYDVFISHSGTDDDFRFVKYVLMQYLENQCKFKLCVEERDFLAGNAIADNVVESIEASKSWIIILTPDYLTAHWSSFQFHVALEQSLKLRSNLVIVLAKELPEDANTDHMKALGHVISVTKCLKWQPDDVGKTRKFWKKLLLQLPKSAAGRSSVLKAISEQQDEPVTSVCEPDCERLLSQQSIESGYSGSPTTDLEDGPALVGGFSPPRSSSNRTHMPGNSTVRADSSLCQDHVNVSVESDKMTKASNPLLNVST